MVVVVLRGRSLHRGSVHLVWACRDLAQIRMHLPAIGENARALNFAGGAGLRFLPRSWLHWAAHLLAKEVIVGDCHHY